MRLADRYGFHAHPNGRSSHGKPTVTGMGIIILLAFTIYLFWQPTLPPLFALGFLVISVVSFLDDIFFLKHSFRLMVQFICLALMVSELPFQSSGIEAIALAIAAIIFGIGVINAYNFMDGLNGMLVLHCVLVLGSMLYINATYTDAAGAPKPFVDSNFILSIMIPMVVFAFFNIRRTALAFIGDVGAIGISFIILFLMYRLLLTTGNYTYLLLFSVFGADAGLTVCYKLILRENIFVPHRDFIFKRLVHVAKLSHLRTSFYFFIAQAVINVFIIVSLPAHPKLSTQLSILFIVVIVLVATYIVLQNRLAFKKKLA